MIHLAKINLQISNLYQTRKDNFLPYILSYPNSSSKSHYDNWQEWSENPVLTVCLSIPFAIFCMPQFHQSIPLPFSVLILTLLYILPTKVCCSICSRDMSPDWSASDIVQYAPVTFFVRAQTNIKGGCRENKRGRERESERGQPSARCHCWDRWKPEEEGKEREGLNSGAAISPALRRPLAASEGLQASPLPLPLFPSLRPHWA